MMETEVGWQSNEDDTGDTVEELWDSSNQNLNRVSLKASLKLEVEEDYSPPSSPVCNPFAFSRKQELPGEPQHEDGNRHESCYKKQGKIAAGVFVATSTNFDLQCEDEALELHTECSEEVQGDLSDKGEGDDDDDAANMIKNEAFNNEDLEFISGAALPYCCKRCGIRFQDLSALQEHKQIHLSEHSYCCPICGKEFFHAANLRMHKLIHSSDRPHKCPECDKGFICTSDVWRHLRNVHKIECSKAVLTYGVVRNPGEDDQKPKEEEPRPYICTTCGKGFRKPNLLYKHKVIHRKDKPYKCQECGMAFVQLMRLKRHQRTHSGERPYYCEECGNTFTRLASLQHHQRIHTGEKPYYCNECGKTYTVMGSLRRHERTHKEKGGRRVSVEPSTSEWM